MKKHITAIVTALIVVQAAQAQIQDTFRVADVQLTGLVLPGYCMQQPACVLQLSIPQTTPDWQTIPEYRLFLQSPIDNNAAFIWCMSRLLDECVTTGTTNLTPAYYSVSLPTNKHPVDALIVNEYATLDVKDCPPIPPRVKVLKDPRKGI